MKIRIIHSSQTETHAVLVGVVPDIDEDGKPCETEHKAEVPLIDTNGVRKTALQVKEELLLDLRKSVSPHTITVGEEIEV